MNQLDRSLHGMELVTVDELEGLIASMKISNVVSMTMNDIASNLASLRMERSRNAEKSTKILDSTSSADFLTAENLKYDATSSTYNSNVGPYGNELQNRHKSMNLSNGTEPVILDDLRRSRSGDNREAKFSEEHGSSSDILRNFNDVNEKDLMIKSYCDTVPAPSEDSPVGQKRVSGLSKFVNPRRASFTKLGLLSKTTPSQSNLDYSGPQLSNDDMPSSPSALNTRKESPESPDYMIDTVDVNWLLGTDEPKVEADSFPDSATARESLPFKYTGTAAYNTVKGPLSTGHSDLLPGDNEAPLSSALDDFSSDSKGTDGAYSEEQKSKAFCDSDQSNRTYSVQSDSTEPGERVPRGKLPFGADAVRNHDDASSSWWGSNGDAREASNNVGEYSNTNSSMVSRTNSYMKRESNDNSSNTSTVDNNTVNRTSIFANASTPDIPANNGKVNQSQDAFVKPTIARMDSLGRSLKRTSITIDTSLISTVGDLESDDDDSSICTIGSDRFFSASQKKASPEVEVALQGKATNIPARVGDMNTVMGDKAQENSVCSSFNAEKRSNFEQPSNDVSYLEGDSCFDSSFENTMKNTDRALMRESNSDTDVTFTDYGSPKGRENGTRSPRSPASPSSPTTPSSSSFISASSPPYTPTPSVHGRTMNSSYNKLSTQQASSSAHRPQGGGVGPQGEGVVPSPLRVQSSANASTAPAQARTDAAPQSASINPTAEDPNTSTTSSSTATSVKKIVEKENGKEREKEKEREAVPSKAYRDFVERNKRNSKVEEHLVKDQKREQNREQGKEQGRETSPPSVAGMVYKDSRTPSVASNARTNATPISMDNSMSVDALAEETVKEPEISPNLMKTRNGSATANNEDTSEYSKYVFSNRSKRNSAVNIPVPDSLISEQQGTAQNAEVDGNGNGNGIGIREATTPERNITKNVSTGAVHASPLRNASSWIKEGNVPHWVRNGSGSESGSGSPQSQFKLKSRDGSFRGSSPPRNGSRTKDEGKERESEKEKEKDSEKDMRERRIEEDKIRESEKGNEVGRERGAGVEKAKENGNADENGASVGADDAAIKATETQPTPTKTREKSKSSEEKPKKKRIILDADTQRLCSQAEIFRREGGEYYSKEDYLKALASFEKSLHLGPKAWGNRPTVLGNRAATFMMLGRYVEAADDCASALTLDPSLIKLHTRRGRALLRLGHLTEAADSFTQACDVSPTLNVQESDLAAVRADGKNGLKSVVGVRSTLTRLGQLEISEDYTGVLGLVEDLNAQCPRSLLVLVSKCNALNKLTEWGETKECIEDFICSAHSSILRLAAHPSAQLPAPPAERLSWTEKQGKNIVIVDTEAVLQAVLAMGPALAELYLISLKNLDLNRNCSSDVMSRMLLIFEELTKFLKSSVKASIPCPDSPPPPLDLGAWDWVIKEQKRIQDTVNYKNQGDKCFRKSMHVEANWAYMKAINTDPLAARWCAVLYNSRAAAHLGTGQLKEAVADCQQAINRDPNFLRAYLRRARILADSCSFAASVRDYKHYLDSTPTPADAPQVKLELEKVQRARKAEQKVQESRQNKADETSKKTERAAHRGSTMGSSASGIGGAFPYNWTKTDFRNTDSRSAAKPLRRGSALPSFTAPTEDSGSNYEPWENVRSSWGDDKDPKGGKGHSSTPRRASLPGEGFVRNGGKGCPYHTLGIDYNSSERQIKLAYRKLALRYHPDKNRDAGAEELFKNVTTAYTLLTDEDTRYNFRDGSARA